MLSGGLVVLLAHVTFQFPPGGPPVVRADAYVASDLSRPHQSVEVDAGAAGVVMPFEPGLDAVVVLHRQDGMYYLHGPFRWPPDAGRVFVEAGARRTVEGRLPHGAGGVRPVWIDAGGAPEHEWPRCIVTAARWQCIGVPADAAGLVALAIDPQLRYALVRPSSGGVFQPAVRSARWAAIVTLEGEAHSMATARLQVLAPRRPSARRRPARIMLSSADGAGVERLTERRYVVSGVEHRDDLLLQVDGEEVALARVLLNTATVGPFQPLSVALTKGVALTGLVVDRSGRPAGGARMALAEVVERPDADGRMETIRRQVAELVSGDDGAFTLRGIGTGRFELLALHPRLGRGTLMFEADGRPLLLRLEPGRRVAGRVLRNGVPLAGVWVDAPASHDGYLSAADPMDVLAPAGTTGADGRFELVLPERGGTELRLDYRGVVTRLPLPAVGEGAHLDLGDVTVRGSIPVRVTYVGDERCALVAAGPLGHTGMTLAEAQVLGPGARLLTLPESGRWLLELRCPRGTARAEPPMLDVPAQASEWSAYVMMAPP